MHTKLANILAKMPVVAIIRGVTPDEVVNIGNAIALAGIGVIEVPLNSPDAFTSIKRLADALGEQCVIGCGTLVKESDVIKLRDVGGKIAVTPNTNPAIIRACLEHGLIPMPGWATPSEAFAAYQAGARYLKLFPAASYGVRHLKAVRAVLPADAKVLAVGGVGSANAGEWFSAGIDGLGIGSELYQPGLSAEQVSIRAKHIVNKIRATR